MNNPQNQEMRNTWGELWKAESNARDFSIYREILERTKWRYLSEDLKGQTLGRALEVGCGSGTLGATMAAVGFETVLLDYSWAAIEVAMRSFANIPGQDRKNYVIGDAFSLPLVQESFDLVVSGGLLEHFDDPEPIVREMSRVLKPGGLFYADIWPRRFSMLRLVERMQKEADGWHEIRLRKQDAIDMVRKCGLTPLRIFTAGVMPPRGVPGTGRFRTLSGIERFVVGKLERFWTLCDGTVIADLLGAYYYVSARKPAAEVGVL